MLRTKNLRSLDLLLSIHSNVKVTKIIYGIKMKAYQVGSDIFANIFVNKEDEEDIIRVNTDNQRIQ